MPSAGAAHVPARFPSAARKVVGSLLGSLLVPGILVVAAAPAHAAPPTTPGAMASLPPSRILDTRLSGGTFRASESRSLQVTSKGGVPSSGVSAVVLNVTVTDTTAGGYLTASPTGTPRPTASNLNWDAAGTTTPNAVTVKVGTGGKVDLYQSGPGTAQVIVDVAGYFVDGDVTDAGGFIALTPARIMDTREAGGAFAPLESRDVQVTGKVGVPAGNVSAVVVNVTVTDSTAGGYLTAYPSGTSRPTASNLNWTAGVTIPNLVTVKVGDKGKVSLYSFSTGTVHVVADVAGYYLGGTPTKPGMFVALAPSRVLDTRSSRPVAAWSSRPLVMTGRGGIPASGVSAVVLNTTVTDTTSLGYLTAYPNAATPPTASNLNWSRPATTVPNLVTVELGSDGAIAFYNGSFGTTQVVADTAGYYLSGPQVDNTRPIYDTLGQRLDAHDGDLLQTADGKMYLYGTAYGCGFRLGDSTTSWCGVRIYRTTDLHTFTPTGAVGGKYAFDHSTSYWQDLCSPSDGHFGCYRPHVVQRPSDGKYVMWINSGGTQGYVTLLADSPDGLFVPTGVDPVLSVDPKLGLRWGDMDLTIAPDGRGYITYTAIDPVDNAHTLVIEQLDATLTTGTGRHVVTDSSPYVPDLAESPALFYGPNKAWYLIYSDPARPFLATGTGVMNGPRNTADPIGSYVQPRLLVPDSCGGQPSGVWPIRDGSGRTAFVYGSDRWDTATLNQAKATNYFGSLTFTSSIADGKAIDAYVCQSFWYL